MRRWILLSILLGCTGVIYSQEATAQPSNTINATALFTVSQSTVRLGDPFELTLTVDVPANSEITEWVEIDARFTPLELIRAEDRTSIPQNNGVRYQQVYHVALWDVGVYTTPEVRVIYRVGEAVFGIPVQSVSLTVPAFLNADETVTIRPSLPQQDLANPVPLVVVVTIGVSVLFVWLSRWLRRRGDARPVSSKVTQTILAQLEDLMGSTLTPQEMILASVERLRAYLAYQHAINAPELTSAEVVAALRSQNSLSREQIRSLSVFLEQADLIKFANLAPTTDPKTFIKALMRWIKLTEQQQETLHD